MARRIPPVLWVALIALGLFSVIQFGVGVSRGSMPTLVAVAFNIVLAAGLYRGARWAFVLILVFAIAGTLVMLVKSPGVGLGVALGNAIVVVPVVLARGFFFGPGAGLAADPVRYCPQCGRPTTDPPTANCPACNPA